MARPKLQADYAWIAENLNKLKVTQSDGSVALIAFGDGLSFNDLITILNTYHTFDADVPDDERGRIINEAVRETARNGAITENLLKGQIIKHANRFMSRPATNFILVTTLSIKRPTDLKYLRFDSANIIFSTSLPPSFSRDQIVGYKQRKLPNDLPSDFTTVRIKVKARSEFEAFKKATDSMDYLRGIWNFSLNRGISARFYSGLLSPINSIRLGPVHTLHLPSGKPATTLFWYEPVYPRESITETLNKWQFVKEEEKQIRKLVNKSRYRQFFKSMFTRYARSLDSIDHDSSFLKLWSLLEFVTVIKENENYDEVIKRCLFLSLNEDYDRRILEHLRSRRNASVHSGESRGRAEELIFQLKRYVEGLMIFHLQMSRRYSTAEAVGQLLAKSDIDALKNRISNLKAELSLNKAALNIHDKARKGAAKSSEDTSE